MHLLLEVIGTADILIAVLAVFYAGPAALAYLAAWPFLAALARLPVAGWWQLDEVLVRVAYYGVPALLIFHRQDLGRHEFRNPEGAPLAQEAR